MNRTFWLTVLSLVFPGGIGAQSIHRFYEDEEVVFKPELVGKWNLGGGTLEFRDLGDNSYGITLQFSPQSAMYFRAQLFCMNDRCFLDGQVTGLKWPEEEQEKAAEAGSPGMQEPAGREFQQEKGDFLLNRAHGLILVSFTPNPDEFLASVWKEGWLPKMAELDKLQVAHTKDEMGRVLLTAETGELHDWLRDVPPEAFEAPERLTRLKNEPESLEQPGHNDEGSPASRMPKQEAEQLAFSGRR